MTDRRSWLRVAVLVAAGLYLWLAFAPLTLVMPDAWIDAGNRTVLLHAWLSNWRWGVDIIDNYGPYGLLYGQEYHPQAVAIVLGLNAVLAAILAIAWLALLSGQRPAIQIALSLLLVTAIAVRRDIFFLAFPLLLAIAHFRDRPAWSPFVAVSLIGAMALANLVKWSLPFVTLPILLLIDLDNLRQRRWPWHLPLCLAAMAVLHLFAGQRLGDLPDLLRLTLDQSGAFPDAMGTPVPLELGLFVLLCGAGLTLIAADVMARARAWRSLALFLVYAVLMFVALKAEFVRYDDVHKGTAWAALALVMTGHYVIVARQTVQLRQLAMLGIAAAALLQAQVVSVTVPPVAAVLWTNPQKAAAELARMLADWQGWKEAATASWQQARARVRQIDPLPAIAGSVDSVPPLQAALLAWDLQYRGRPTMQEHQAYTPRLLQADAAFFLSAQAPTYLLFRPGSIDDRYPTLVEGSLWPLFLSCYRPDQWAGDIVVLRRRPGPCAPAEVRMTRRASAGWREWIDLRSETAPVVFARLRADLSIAGRVTRLLFRPPLVYIVVLLSDGRAVIHRFPRPLAEAGFILSPYVESTADYVALAGDAGSTPSPARVLAFGVFHEDGREHAFRGAFEFELGALDLTGLRPDPSPR
jgi:hypothetical protein